MRWIRFEVDSSYYGDLAAGGALGQYAAALSEIQFFEATEPPPVTFSSWISGYSGLGGLIGFNDDPDGDGNDNGVENYFGTHPGEFSQGMASGVVTGNTFTFSHPLNSSPAADLTAIYKWSTDLSAFHNDGATNAGTTVDFVQSAPVDGIVTVTATVTGEPVEQLFVSIEVTVN